MRLDARVWIPGPMVVWDAEACRVVPRVVWVDDETAEYGCYYDPQVIAGNVCITQTFQARKIVIRTDLRLVVINPIDDELEQYVEEARKVETA